MFNTSYVRPLRSTLTCVAAIGFTVTASAGPAASQSIWETRVFIDSRCPTDPPPPAAPAGGPAPLPALAVSVLGFLIPKAIDFGLSVAGKALTDKAAAENAKNNPVETQGVATADAFYRLEGGSPPAMSLPVKDHCLIFVRGNFGKPPTSPNPDCDNFKQAALRQDQTCRWLNSKGIFSSSTKPNDPVGMYLEARFVFPDEGTSFRMQPNYFSYPVPLKDPEQPTDKYDATFEFHFEPAATTQAVTPFGLVMLGFQQIRPQIVLTKEDLVGKTSGWSAIPPLSAPEQDEVERVKAMFDAQTALNSKFAGLPDGAEKAQAKQDLDKKVAEINTWRQGKRLQAPFTVRVKLTEQPFLQKNLFILTAAEAFSASKQDIGNFVSPLITQALGLQSKDVQNQKTEAQATALIAAMTQLNNARKAQADLDQLAPDATAQTKGDKKLALETAKINANVAHIKAGLTPPFPDAFAGQ